MFLGEMLCIPTFLILLKLGRVKEDPEAKGERSIDNLNKIVFQVPSHQAWIHLPHPSAVRHVRHLPHVSNSNFLIICIS